MFNVKYYLNDILCEDKLGVDEFLLLLHDFVTCSIEVCSCTLNGVNIDCVELAKNLKL